MPIHALTGFIVYALVNSFTPGPGNILALGTTSAYGWRRGKPLVFGIFAGYLAVQEICAFVVFAIGANAPALLGALKYVGVVYIAWLAIHIARSKPDASDAGKSASFLEGFLLQFVNVKVYLYGITALGGFVTPYFDGLAPLMGICVLIAALGSVATLVWAGCGVVLQRVYREHFRAANMIFAISLAACAVMMLLE